MKTIKHSIQIIAIKAMAVVIFVILMSPLYSYKYAVVDNTATLQAMLDAGDVTLPAGGNYYVTGLIVTHNLDLNGSVINMIGDKGALLSIDAANVKINNGELKGTWNGIGVNGWVSGIQVSDHSDGVSINKLHIDNLSGYGISAGFVNNISITNCNIVKVGYIGFFYDAENYTTGGTFSNNIVDRSMLAPEIVTQPAVCIRGSRRKGSITSNWMITKNEIRMPHLPKDWSAACMELRYVNNGIVTKNFFKGGTIGASFVGSNSTTISYNRMRDSQLEGIEIAGGQLNTTSHNSINGSAQAGILIDGDPATNDVKIYADTISNAAEECIHAYNNTSNLTITGCVLSVMVNGVNLQRASNVTINNTSFDGHGAGKYAVTMDCCPGYLKINGGSIKNLKKCTISVYNNQDGLTTDNILMTNVTVKNVPNSIIPTLQHGGMIGKNIIVN